MRLRSILSVTTIAGAAFAGLLSFAAVNANAQCAFSTNAANITETCGSVGIGTTTPVSILNVVAASNPAVFIDSYSNSLGQIPFVFRTARGTSGAPAALQAGDIFGGVVGRGYRGDTFSGGSANIIFAAAQNWSPTSTPSTATFRTTPSGGTAGVDRMTIDMNGNVGIGTSTPGSRLDVAGDVNVSGNIAAKYQDVAEWVPSPEALDAGTVVILDATHPHNVKASFSAYDTSVAGVVSSNPGVILGEAGQGKVKVATTGRVLVKVDATKHPVRVGDLLVTSNEPGVAMRSQPINVSGMKIHRPGTIIGKALDPLPSGKGEIMVLLSLQ